MMASTIKSFHHKWRNAEYLVLLQVNSDHREEVCDNVPIIQSLIACVLECAVNRGFEVPDAAYERLNDALAQSIRDI
jgi:hypothetical protein